MENTYLFLNDQDKFTIALNYGKVQVTIVFADHIGRQD